MIKLSIVTEMTFKNLIELNAYRTSRELDYVTGFKEEIWQAMLKWGQRICVKTPRPEYGAIVTSFIKVEDMPDSSLTTTVIMDDPICDE